MKVKATCKICNEFLKIEEMQRGTCEDCEKEVTLLVNQQLSKKTVGWR